MAQQFCAALIVLAIWSEAVGAASVPVARPPIAAASAVKPAPGWNQLKPEQQTLLAPLAKDWDSFTNVRKRKWLGIADRYPSMTPKEQVNLRERMADWSKLTTEQREKARTQYKKLRTVPPEERRTLEQKWQEYDALPAEQKQRLKQTPKATSLPSSTGAKSMPLQPPKPVVVVPSGRTPKKPLQAATPLARKSLPPVRADKSVPLAAETSAPVISSPNKP